MKKIFLLVCLLFAINTAFAQSLYTREDTVLITQDSVTLQAGKFRGTIQWQYSPDKKTWNNLNGKIKETLKVIKSAEGYYRAEIIDHNCSPLYSDTAQIKPGFNISKTITAQAGGSIITPDNSTLTIPANSLQTDGKVTISTVDKSELLAIVNPNLQRFLDSYKLEIPGDTLLNNITLTFTLDSVPSPIENFVPCLYDGNSYIPMEYTINGNAMSVTIDVIKWKNANNLKNATSLSNIVIEFFISKQTPPEEEMGLKEVSLVAGRLQFNNPSQISETSKVLLLVHGWNDKPSTWTSFVQQITAEKNIKFDKIWTFGYNSSWKIEENATKLADALSKYSNGAKVRIVGHSMGGLVSRSMIEYHGGINYVKKLITMGTPHHGSPMAAIRDWIGKNIIQNEESANESLTGASVIYNCFTQGFKDLQENSDFILKMEKLSQPPLPYYCIAAKQPVDNPKIPGDDDIVVAVGSALGVPNAKATAIININSLVAHNAMLSNANVYQKVKEYLADKDTILIVSGNKQSGSPSAKLAQPIVVQVQDESKNPVKSKSVFFSFAQGVLARFGLKSVQINVSEDKTDTLALETDNEGKISLDWTLGKNGGDQKFEAFLKDDGNTKIDSSAIKITATACGCDTTKFGHFTDSRDGHVYKTIKIGTQTWMAENLAYLPQVHSVDDWSISEPRYYCGNSHFGVAYNFKAALISCPAGWHLSNDNEWNVLFNYLGGIQIAGVKMCKETFAKGLISGNNSSCFSIDKGLFVNYDYSFRTQCNNGIPTIIDIDHIKTVVWNNFENEITYAAGVYWSATLFGEDWDCNLSGIMWQINNSIYRNVASKLFGYQVRCIKD